jgi:hypothetical protein
MRQLLLLLFTISFISVSGQDGSAFEGIFNSVAVLDMSPIGKQFKDDDAYSEEERKKILQKQYLTVAYNPALVDEFTTPAYLRYNLYNDQMEFVKNENIYYLKKEKGRRVHFTTLNTTYKVFELYGDLEFFLVQVEAKSSLLVKQESRFIEPRKANSTYAQDKKADFKRRKDVYYLALNGGSLVKLSTKKKEFATAFKGKEKEMKAYIKKNKLNPKKLKDMEIAVTYFNTL